MEIKIANDQDINELMDIRLEMVREVNDLGDDYCFSEQFIANTKQYFLHGDQTTVLAMEEGKAVACASISYIQIIPTLSHPTGNRAHLINVYTTKKFRRQRIAYHMIKMLIREAKLRKVTEISLDATDLGRPLYKSLGFSESTECMILNLL